MAKGEYSCSENVVHEGAVAEVREKMHDGAALDTVAGFFKVLGDGTRMRIISAPVSYTHLDVYKRQP